MSKHKVYISHVLEGGFRLKIRGNREGRTLQSEIGEREFFI